MKTKTVSRRNALKLGAGAAGVLAMPFYARNALAETPIKLGSLLDSTGTIGLEGSRMTQTTQYAVDVLNKAGGLLGRPIQLISYDTQSSMQLYSQYAQQLVLQDKVDVVQGGITSASREAIRIARLETSEAALDMASHEFSHGGRTERLSAREYALMQALMSRPGRILSRAEIEERLYGWGDEVESNAVEVLIHSIRRKFGKQVILNIRGAGWMVEK